MHTSVAGVYQDGHVKLLEVPRHIKDNTHVVVNFPGDEIDLQAHGIGEKEAAELRARLATFAEDWDSPEMDVYDNYDDAKSLL